MVVALVALTAFAPGCGTPHAVRSPLSRARDDARGDDPDALGRLLLAELTAAGGTRDGAQRARERLDRASDGGKRGGVDAKLAAALDDDVHGQGPRAFDEWISVLHAAHASSAARAPLVAIVAIDAVVQLAPLVPRRHRDEALLALAPLIAGPPDAPPGRLGWRAAAEVARVVAATEARGKLGAERDSISKRRRGCVEAIRLAGPFESAPGDDETSALEGETPRPWPTVFDGRPGATVRPRVVQTERSGCVVSAAKPPALGTYLAEAFVGIDRERDVAILVNDTTRVTIDDVVVHINDKTTWGSGLHDGVVVRLEPGRHRIVWRASGVSATLEIRQRDGAPLEVKAATDATPAYGEKLPTRVDDVDPILSVAKDEGRDPVTVFLAARAAVRDGAGDVAAVVLGPPLDGEISGTDFPDLPPPVLELAASAAAIDPIWPTARASSRARALYERASELDPGLWRAPLEALRLRGEGTQAVDRVRRLQSLTSRGFERADAALDLLELYKELGWTHEHDALVRVLVAKFPDDPSVLRAHLRALDERGPLTQADAVAQRLAQNEPTQPVLADRLLARRDFAGALAAYDAFLHAHPDDKGLSARIDEVRAHLDDLDAATARLSSKIPLGEATPLDEADLRVSRAEPRAFDLAIEHSIRERGERPAAVLRALDLFLSTVDFAPFRLDARKAIAEHDASHAGRPPLGAAERILDYGVLWVRSDGSSAFLEQELVRVHSREAIEELSRVAPRKGKALHLRVLKVDGRELEPQRVAGKPDLTFPDLEVGDVVDTETITFATAPANAFVAPRWYFAEPRVAYARSEYITLTPKGHDVILEARAGAPAPKLSSYGPFELRRWRVDDAPPAPDEPEHRAPADEITPNVTLGWGVKLDEAVARAAASLKEATPVDPRIAARARAMVAGVPQAKTAERARRLYDWIVRNIQKGQESDGRRVITGGSGDAAAAFRTLARAIGIPTYVAVAHDRLAPGAPTLLSAGDGFRHPLLLLPTDEGDRFTSFGGRFLPFGYVPAAARGEEAIVLRPGAPRVRVTVASAGPTAAPLGISDLPADANVARDGVRVVGALDVAASGDASGVLTMSFSGGVAAQVREAVEQLTEGELHAAVESKILAAELPGVHLRAVEVGGRNELGKPLSLRVEVEVPGFARASGRELVVVAPFQRRFLPFAARPKRLTPLLLQESDRREVAIDLRFPSGPGPMKIVRGPVHGERAWGHQRVQVGDTAAPDGDGRTLRVRRAQTIDVERIEPPSYAAFQSFCRAADALDEEETVVRP